MADLSEGALEASKIGGAGGAGAFLMWAVGRVFNGQDKQIAVLSGEVRTLVLAVNGMQQQLAVLVDGTKRRDDDVRRLEGIVAEQAKELAALKAIVQQFSEGIAR